MNFSTRAIRDAKALCPAMQVRDLLGENLEQDLELQKTATGFTIPSLTKVPVTSAQQITEVMQRGYVNRCTAAHDINVHSSRSHALLIVEVASVNLASGIKSVGKLTLCDLAGRCDFAAVLTFLA
jgi:kinesin family protein C2/C3